MKSYYIVKKVSKSLVLLSLIAVMVSGGLFFVSKNQIGADTNTAADYEIMMNGNTVEGILANNIKSSVITGFDYNSNKNSDIEKVSGECRLGSNCYLVWNKKSWNDPSIRVDDGQKKPAWVFLQEVKGKAQNAGDTDGVNRINSVSANYVADAFIRDLKPNFDFTSTGGTITIPYQAFIDKLNSLKIETKDPYVEFYEENGLNKAKMKFASAYPEAKVNSAWLAAADFVLNSMIKPYKDAGLDASQYENAINQAVKTYSFGTTGTDSKDELSFTYPNRILLSAQSNNNFEYNINIDKFPTPENGYKTKIFIKPTSKKDSAPYILFGPFGESSRSFFWAEATQAGYTVPSGQNIAGLDDYNLNFPQQYFVRAVTYDGDTAKAEVIATIETHNENTASGQSIVESGNAFLKISAQPAAVNQGETVKATIEAIQAGDPNKQITKVVFYACTGTAESVAGTDSSTCTYKNAEGQTEDAVKAAFSGSSLVFVNGRAKVSATWNTSGSAIGNHALMAKAFSGSSGDSFIDGSKTVVTVQITNSNVGAAGGGANSGNFTDLLAGMFSDNATDNPTGSSLRTTGELATRIIKILLIAISVLSVIAIIVGGIFYITAGGDQQKSERGKKTVLYACIGITITVLTYVIEGAVINIINNLVG